jgi:hypothetical protein
MGICQGCSKQIADGHGRWMFTPEGVPPQFHLDKCQSCGPWTPAQEAIVTARVQEMIKAGSTQKLGGCNCTGKR